MPESITLETLSSQASDTDESDEEEEEGTKWESASESDGTSSSSASDEDQAATEVYSAHRSNAHGLLGTAPAPAPNYWTPRWDHLLQWREA